MMPDNKTISVNRLIFIILRLMLSLWGKSRYFAFAHQIQHKEFVLRISQKMFQNAPLAKPRPHYTAIKSQYINRVYSFRGCRFLSFFSSSDLGGLMYKSSSISWANKNLNPFLIECRYRFNCYCHNLIRFFLCKNTY